MSDRSDTEEKKKPFWLKGNFAPVFEETTSTDLEVTGQIPADLSGHYLRNGANPPTGESLHWFFGAGMIHGVELNGGKALGYRNRYMRTPAFEQADSDPLDTLGNLGMSLANTHVVEHAGKILALEEGHYPFELERDLESVGPYNFDGKLDTGMTAHPKICPETGEMLFFAYSITPPYLTYHRADADGRLVQSEQIEVKGATMVHDFNATRNHVIFMDLPLVWDMEALASGLPIRWSDDYGARLGVMPRDGSNEDVVWYDIDPCYVFHPMNAYEDGDKIVLDVCRSAMMMNPGVRDEPTMLHQWVIDTAEGRVSERPLDDRSIDFPRVPDSHVGLPYRYGYTAEFGSDGPAAVAFRKYDMQTGTSTAHDLGAGRTGGEPVFVPSSQASAEDDGYLLSYVYDAATDKSELVIVDASRMESEPLARVHLPVRVPAGFHGNWFAAD